MEFVGSVIKFWRPETEKFEDREIADLSNEELLNEYGSEEAYSSRSDSSDPPSPMNALRDEILKRMAR